MPSPSHCREASFNCDAAIRAADVSLRTTQVHWCSAVPASLRTTALFALMFLAGREASALGRDLTLQQLEHRSWTNWNFAPDTVTAIVQTPDGWLWLASAAGIHRFTGFEFQHPFWRRDVSPITSAAMVGSDGSLWLGLHFGGVSRTDTAESVVLFGIEDGLPDGAVHALVEDRRGVVWAATSTGLARFSDGHWQTMRDWDFTAAGVFGAMVAHDDTLWLATRDRVVAIDPSRSEHRTVLSLTSATAATKYFAQAPDESVWLSAPGSGVLRVDLPSPRQHWFKEQRIGQILFDRDGQLWMAGDGLHRLRPSEAGLNMDPREAQQRTEVFKHVDGLSSNAVRALFEDREGTLWVATSKGVDRFAASIVVSVPEPAGMQSWGEQTLVTTEQGSLWVAASGGPALLHYQDGRLTEQLAAPLLTAGTRAPDGSIWFGGPQGVGRIEQGQFKPIPLPPEALGSTVLAMTHDPDGALWVSIEGKGVFTLTQGTWQPAAARVDLPAGNVFSMATTDAGDVWLGYARDRMARISQDNVTVFSADLGLQLGTIASLTAIGNAIWIGGDNGLGLFDGGRFHRFTAYTCQPFSGISGIVETSNGDLWVARSAGITAVPSARSGLSAATKEHRVKCRGLNRLVTYGTPQVRGASRSLAHTSDGRLWIAAVDGLKWMDLNAISNVLEIPEPEGPPAILPRAQIHSLTWFVTQPNGERQQRNYVPKYGEIVTPWVGVLPGPPKLPPHTRDVYIGYTAPAARRIEHLQFRHRLLGNSEYWQHSPLRQSNPAVYTNLGPGKYRFEVATIRDGEAPQAQSALEFEILPAFYQTRWFHALCALLAIIALALLFRFQLRRAGARLGDRLEARMHERERIARELHDTLLQSIQGLILKIHSIAVQMPERTASRTSLEHALGQAQQVLIEGRERVTALRESHQGDSDITEDIAKLGERLAADIPTKFQCRVHGKARQLHPIVREEAFLVIREAMLNAFRHAHASHVATDIFFERTALRITVADDGLGVPPEILAAGRREGHWGMTGMRERTARIRGTLNIESIPGAGVHIELRVPAAVAYRLSVGKSRQAPRPLDSKSRSLENVGSQDDH